MDPFLPTWLAQHAVPLAGALLQCVVAVIAAAAGRSFRAAVLWAGASVTGVWLLPGLAALIRSEALPAPGVSQGIAELAPWITLAVLAAAGPRRRSTALTPRSLLALGLGVYGPGALLASIALIATGRLEADSRRSAVLAAGLVGLLALRAADYGRFALHSLVSTALAVGPDAAVLVTGAATACVAALTWGALGTWGVSGQVGSR